MASFFCKLNNRTMFGRYENSLTCFPGKMKNQYLRPPFLYDGYKKVEGLDDSFAHYN